MFKLPLLFFATALVAALFAIGFYGHTESVFALSVCIFFVVLGIVAMYFDRRPPWSESRDRS